MLVAEVGVEPTQFKLMRLARCRFSTLPKMQTVWGKNRLLRRKTKCQITSGVWKNSGGSENTETLVFPPDSMVISYHIRVGITRHK